jgi:hypothetical protein
MAPSIRRDDERALSQLVRGKTRRDRNHLRSSQPYVPYSLLLLIKCALTAVIALPVSK